MKINLNRIPVFVYGTLRHNVRGRLIADANTIDQYFMYDGTHPIVVNPLHDTGNGLEKYKARVYGQLYYVGIQEFARLDSYEGFPKFYTRKMVPVVARHPDYTEFEKAWMYLAREDGTGAAGTCADRDQVRPNALGYLNWTPPDKIPF